MQKKSLHSVLIASLSSVLIVSLVLVGYFYQNQTDLQAKLDQQIEKAAAAEDSIDDLERELSGIKSKQNAYENLPPLDPPSSLQDLAEEVIEEAAQESDRPASLPHLVVEPTVLDLGTISQQEGLVSGSFQLKNQGGSELKIYSTFSSCGCTTIPLKSKTIAAGESVDLDVEYDPNYFKGYLGQGDIEKQITIISNDPVNPFLKVALKTHVTP